MTAAQRLADGIDRFIDLVGRATSWLALGIALVMGANVLLRYGFSIGSIWMQELEWHIMVPICVFGMSYALLHGEHVRVDVVFQYFTPRNKHLVDVITAICSACCCRVIVIWLSHPLRLAVLEHRRGHRQSRRHRLSLHHQGADPDRLRAVLPAVAVRGDQELPRLPGRLMCRWKSSPS